MSLEDKLQQATGAAKELAGKVTGDKSAEIGRASCRERV